MSYPSHRELHALVLAGIPPAAALRIVRTVVKAGVVYDPADLLRSVEGKIGPKEN